MGPSLSPVFNSVETDKKLMARIMMRLIAHPGLSTTVTFSRSKNHVKIAICAKSYFKPLRKEMSLMRKQGVCRSSFMHLATRLKSALILRKD